MSPSSSVTLLALVLLTGCEVRIQLGARDGGSVDGGADGGVWTGANCPALGELPAWRQGLTVGSWVRLPNTALSLVTPSPRPVGSLEARLDGPAGMAADTENNVLYVAASGGNSDYSGNEVYRLRLASPSPTWEIVTPPSDPSQITPDQPYNRDGKPSAAWGYYGTWFIEPIHQVMRFSATGVWGAGAVFPTIDGWDAVQEAWLPAGTHPTFPGTVLFEMPTAKDFSTGDLYQFHGDNHLYRWRRQTDVVEDLGATTLGLGSFYEVSEAPLVFEPIRGNLIFLSDDTNPAKARVWNVTTRQWSTQALTGPAAAALISTTDQSMAYFDPCWEQIVVKANAPDVLYRIDPVTLEVTAWSTTGALPAVPLGGVHTLFQMLPSLGGYAFQPRTGSGVYFLPTR